MSSHKLISDGTIVLRAGDRITDLSSVNYSADHLDQVKLVVKTFDAFARNGKAFATGIVGKDIVITDVLWEEAEDKPLGVDGMGATRVKFAASVGVNDGMWLEALLLHLMLTVLG